MTRRFPVGGAPSKSTVTSVRSWTFLAAALAVLAGLLVVSHGAAATDGSPEVRLLDEVTIEPGQTFVLVAENTNADAGDTIEWSVATSDDAPAAWLRTSGDNQTLFVKMTVHPDSSIDAFDVHVTATDPDDQADTTTTHVDVDDQGDLQALDPRDELTGRLVESPSEDTPVSLRLAVADTGTAPDVAAVDAHRVYPDGRIEAASRTNPGTYEAGTFFYDDPGLYHTGFEVTDSSEARIILVDHLEVTESAPQVMAPPRFQAIAGQEIVLIANVEDSDDEPVEWTVERSEPAGRVRSTSDERAIFQFDIGWGEPEREITITWKAQDPHGRTGTAETVLDVGGLGDPTTVRAITPLELSTNLRFNTPIVGEPVRLTGHGDADVVRDLDILKDGIGGPRSDGDDSGDGGRVDLETTFEKPIKRKVAYLGEIEAGGEGGVLQLVQPLVNDPPRVDASPDVVLQGPGTAQLTAFATDPELRPLGDFEWFYVDGPRLGPSDDELFLDTGKELRPPHTRFTQLGVHEFEVRVMDPYGATGTDSVTVTVDDVIEASGHLTTASGQRNGVQIVDPIQRAGSNLEGNVSVVDGRGNPVADAVADGEVVYFGSQESSQGTAVGRFAVTTDASGNATFEFAQEVAGAAQGPSIASLPGYHEIQFTVSADSDPDAPIDDTETTEFTIPYVVQPQPGVESPVGTP